MVDAYLGQRPEHGHQVGQVCGVDVHLGVPAGQLVHTPGDGVEVFDGLGAAAANVEAHGPHSGCGKGKDLFVGGGDRQLGDADVARTEAGQRVEEVVLVEALERARHHRATDDIEMRRTLPIVLGREGRRDVAVVGHEGKARVDDV